MNSTQPVSRLGVEEPRAAGAPGEGEVVLDMQDITRENTSAILCKAPRFLNRGILVLRFLYQGEACAVFCTAKNAALGRL